MSRTSNRRQYYNLSIERMQITVYNPTLHQHRGPREQIVAIVPLPQLTGSSSAMITGCRIHSSNYNGNLHGESELLHQILIFMDYENCSSKMGTSIFYYFDGNLLQNSGDSNPPAIN